MPRPAKFKQVVKVLNSLGYFEVRQKGSHVIFENSKGDIAVSPNHGSKDITFGLLKKICDDVNISTKDFWKALDK